MRSTFCMVTHIASHSFKLKFHGTDTNTDTDIHGHRRVRRLPHSACHEPDTHDDPRRLVRRLFLARMSVRDVRVYTCKRVVYTISYRVHVYKITR